MRRAGWTAGLALLAACETAPMNGSGEGAPVEAAPVAADLGCEALVPIDAADTAEGVARERAWLAENYPGFEVLSEAQDDCDGVPVDRVVFVQDGIQHTVMFDTSAFYGRVDGDDLDVLLEG